MGLLAQVTRPAIALRFFMILIISQKVLLGVAPNLAARSRPYMLFD